MWKAYLFVLVVVSVNGPLEGRRSNSDASDRGCRRTNSEPHRLCVKSCSSDKDCRENRKCLCDGDCGLSCVKPNLNCGYPPKPRNSIRRMTNGTVFNSVVTYTCKKPYELRGSAKRTCRAIEKWDGKNARCKIFCDDPGDIQSGSRRVEKNSLQAGRGGFLQYWCGSGYKLEGKEIIHCQENGKWSAPKPKCVLPECDPPSVPDSASVTYPRKMPKKHRYNDRVILKCKVGYFKSGLGYMQCDKGNTWRGSIICRPKSCGDPGKPDNGAVKGRVYLFKSKIEYECDKGYQLKGPAYRNCQANQIWSGRQPTCEVVNCGSLDEPIHGEIIESVGTTFGKRIVFRCNDIGYEIKGSAQRTCQSDGSWSGSKTTCELVTCGDPGTPENGKQIVTKGYVYGGSVKFECNNDYTLRGKVTIYCQADKTWRGSVPECLAPCSDPGVPYQGDRIVGGLRHDQTVTFTCPRDHVMKGARTIMCSNGRWSNEKPSCLAPCGDPGSPKNGWKSGRDYIHAKSVRFGCYRGYQRIGAETITCQDGRWSNKAPVCKGICGKPSTPYNGFLRGNRYLDGDEVTFICKRNYDLLGSSKLRCVGRNWDLRVPECKGRCKFLGNPFKGYEENVVHRIGEALPHGSHVEYACEPKHTLVGSKVLYCIDESWNASIPTCKAPCADPGYLQRGSRVGNNLLHGHTVTYKCFKRYSLVGKRQLTCNDGHWSSKLPECKESCQAVEALDNGTVHGNSYNHGEEVSFSCDIGYKLSGSRGVICADGKWNDSSPTCKGACQNPGIFEHGSITGKDYSYGSSISFSCDNGYELRGSKNLTCNKGVWSSHTPVCKKRCNNPGKMSNGFIIGVNFTHGGTVAFICYTDTDDTFDVIGAPNITCKDGQWSAPKPSCQARCTDPGRPNNGAKDGSDYRSGATVTFKCSAPLQLEGDRTITCNNGKWSGSRPSCSACGLPLGIENHKVTDWRRFPSVVRLHGPPSWCMSQAGEYLQIDLDKPYKLTAIATQGSQDLDRWVSNYRIKFKAGAHFLFYRESGSKEVIQGNTDATAVTKYTFKRPFIAQNIRIYPVVERDRHCLKTELHGCSPPPGCILVGSLFWGKWTRKQGVDNYYKVYITKLDHLEMEFELLVNINLKPTYNVSSPVLILDEIPAPTDIYVGSKVIALHGDKHRDWFRTGAIEKINRSGISPYFVRFENNESRWVAREDLRLVRRPRICPEQK